MICRYLAACRDALIDWLTETAAGYFHDLEQ